jgi:pimeloyl-ACP methyl ester carboxylesterase
VNSNGLSGRLNGFGVPLDGFLPGDRKNTIANLEVADETAERVFGHSLGGLMATYNVSRHWKQKMGALVALEAAFRRVVGEQPVGGRRRASAASFIALSRKFLGKKFLGNWGHCG